MNKWKLQEIINSLGIVSNKITYEKMDYNNKILVKELIDDIIKDLRMIL